MRAKRLAILTMTFFFGGSVFASNEPQVYVLGTTHGNMLSRPQNSLRDFVAALTLFRPQIILNEVRPEIAARDLAASRDLLRQRLESGHYKVGVEDLKEKLAEFDLWIAKTKSL